MGLWAKSVRIFNAIRTTGKQSVRRLGERTGFSKSSVHRHFHTIERRDRYPESWLWETEEGRSWLIRLVVATLFMFGQCSLAWALPPQGVNALTVATEGGGFGLRGKHMGSHDMGESDPVILYQDLLKRSLVNWYYGHTVMHKMDVWGLKRRFVASALGRMGFVAAEAAPIPSELLLEGKGMCTDAYTMVGLKRLDNVEKCVTDVLDQGVPGDFLEAGVWKGGTCIFMRGLLKAHGVRDRMVWVADSFRGLPPPNLERYPQDATEHLHEVEALAISLDEVRGNFARYGLLDDQVQFLEGYFRDTLHVAPIEKLALLRLDGDMYESTMDTLVALYPKVSVGGYVIIDDYARENCAQAVNDYRAQHGIDDEIHWVDWTATYWQKTINIREE